MILNAQCSSGDCKNGKGTYLYGENKYVGEFKNGNKNGKGTYYYANGNKYEGDFRFDKFNGKGKLTYSNSNIYEGEFKDGKKVGKGTFYLKHNEKYIGEFRYNKFNGPGTYYYINGDKYRGSFKDGKKNGKGTYYYAMGNKYTGEFRNDIRNGMGTFYFINGNKYHGIFDNGKRNGQGTFYYSNGNKYTGEFSDDKFYGQGTFYYSNGAFISGEWFNNALKTESDVKSVFIAGKKSEILYKKEASGYNVSAKINGIIDTNMIIDPDSDGLLVSSDLYMSLIKAGTIKKHEFIGIKSYSFPNGTYAPSPFFLISSIKLGNNSFFNIKTSVSESLKAPLVFGQKAIEEMGGNIIINSDHFFMID